MDSPTHANQPKGLPTVETRRKCLGILLEVAAKHNVAPALVVAHTVEPPAVNDARKEVQRRMFTELKMRRRWIAYAFGRSIRRVRRSVIGV